MSLELRAESPEAKPIVFSVVGARFLERAAS
jgi:hypothetical protein